MLSLASASENLATRTAAAYVWSGVAIMWGFWVSFVIFLAEPRQVLAWWPLPTVDRSGSVENLAVAALIDMLLVAMFGLQHSVMARPWFKQSIMRRMPAPVERATFVHMANLALFALLLGWQSIPVTVWDVGNGAVRDAIWVVFAGGWTILLLGAWSFGLGELLGSEQLRAWREGRPHTPRLKTGLLYRWLRHPMYVGVLVAVWATPRMSVGHLLLALGFTAYVLIAMRYEERDLLERFGSRYSRWRDKPSLLN